MLNILKKMNVSILKFILFNSVLPTLDVGTDIKAFLFYLSLEHVHWAVLTVTWIVVPFAIHLVKFLYQFAKTRKAEWRDLFLHIPFVLPFRNLYYAYLLHKLGFGKPNFESKNWAAVEAIQNEVARDGLSESYFESGPQAHFSYLSYLFALEYPDLKMLCLKINDKYEIC